LVADGMGGMSSGGEASRTAARIFLEAYAEKKPEEPIFDALRRAAFRANDAVLEIGNGVFAPGEAGTTLVAAVIHEGALYWLSVGDSRVYLLDATSIRRLNEEHNLKTRLLKLARQGLADAEEAETHPQRDALTSYIGIEDLMEIDMPDDALQLKGGEQVILCSDGLYRALSENEIFETARHAFAGDAAHRLVENALEKGFVHQDNVTVVTLSVAENGGREVPRTDAPLKAQPRRPRPVRDVVTLKPGAVKRSRKKKFPWLFCFILAAVAAGAAVAAFFPYLKNYFGGGN
jgi:protein phosphatase